MINDIVALNYVTFQGSENLIIGGVETPLTFHWLAHTFQSGHCVVCTIIVCIKETYNDSGIAHWVFIQHMAGEILFQW